MFRSSIHIFSKNLMLPATWKTPSAKKVKVSRKGAHGIRWNLEVVVFVGLCEGWMIM